MSSCLAERKTERRERKIQREREREHEYISKREKLERGNRKKEQV